MSPEMKSVMMKRKGAALVMVMFAVTLLMITGTGLLFMSYQSRLIAIRMTQDTASRVCADAGLAKAISVANAQYAAGTLNDADLPVSIGETLPASEGAFSYRIIKNENGDYVAVSVGARGGFRRVIQATLRIKVDTVFDYGLLTKGQCTLQSNMAVSGYDSRDPSVTNAPFDFGTIGTAYSLIPIGSGTVVNANVFCGVGGVPNNVIPVNGTLNGTKYALTTAPTFVTPTMPSLTDKGATSKTAIAIKGTTVTYTPSSSGKYYRIDVQPNGATPGELVIDGGKVTIGITGFIQLGTGCKITVKKGSTLLLYLDGHLYAYDKAVVKYDDSAVIDPSRVQIYGTAALASGWQQIAISSQAVIAAAIYAPYAHVSVGSSAGIYGSIFSTDLNFTAGTTFKYDVALGENPNVVLQQGAGEFVVKRWTESVVGGVPDWAG